MHIYYLSDNEGLPAAFLLEDLPDTNGLIIFGTLDGEGLTKYKIGNELNTDPHLMLQVFKKLFPSKIDKITHLQPCFYAMSHDDEFIFEKHGNTVYGFGDCGRGFKHMFYHGKRVFNILKGDEKEASKFKKILTQPQAKL